MKRVALEAGVTLKEKSEVYSIDREESNGKWTVGFRTLAHRADFEGKVIFDTKILSLFKAALHCKFTV